ncbi:3-oxoacyl-ACP reductase [Janibacter alkaliphilus]|uniref:3-oxoacyl-[acyl-carrier protein] reductase n=1 Tax=Janibacter alkaliphilus TaxID=1069963 RepID=A0A852X6G3_9MICO|nr:3-oxoacyl-ACP reductase [Janibacter alkaliphilus]NYG38017.1 3-oxoacyl-[acyl-carrier protein] reductase [Janibacter alkaliphilus]
MAFDYGKFVSSGFGKQLATSLGLPRPTKLRRQSPGDPLIGGAVLVDGHGDTPVSERVRVLLESEGVQVATSPSTSVAGVVIDMTQIETPADLETLRAIAGPALKTLAPTGRVIVVGRPVEEARDVAQAAARRALEGIVRSIGKEMRGGGTANTVYVAEGAESGIDATIRFFLSGRSAYVDAQVVHVGEPVGELTQPSDWDQPLADKVAVVTGAARGIGAAIAEVLARDGATVVCVDIPAAGGPLAEVANRLGGSALQLDVTAEDAGAKIVDHATSLHGGFDIVVHNAGITRDKLLVNTDADRWHSVLDVNLLSILRMNEALVSAINAGGHIVNVASIAGIAGNRGQTNYGASKAGVIGMTSSLAEELRSKGVTVNAVAPGFIETEMTAKIPLATREVGRLTNSLSQGGLPVDVAETIGWFAWDANRAVTGNTVRVCGQMLLGA